MAYLQQENADIGDDIYRRKEFNALAHDTDVKPLDDTPLAQIIKNESMTLQAPQEFTRRFISPNTPYNRLLIFKAPGSGKTIESISVALEFIKEIALMRTMGIPTLGTVFVIGFTQRIFKAELLKYPELKYISRKELAHFNHLKRLAQDGLPENKERLIEFQTKLRRRITNKKNNGLFEFYGYKEFVNRLLIISDTKLSLSEMNEAQIKEHIQSGGIQVNTELLERFQNSILICDEIHNVYNTCEKNNWGIALQIVLDKYPNIRVLLMSGTPINNSPTEIIDLLNLLTHGKKKISRSDIFDANCKLINPGVLRDAIRGKIVALQDANPVYYPQKKYVGVKIPGIDYLYFIRSKMPPLQYSTYKNAYHGTLAQDAQYLLDFVAPNPNDPDNGIYRTADLDLLHDADQAWKDKNKIKLVPFNNEYIISGDFLKLENIGKYSGKYETLLKDILHNIRTGKGKMFIYHHYVHMSGVLLLQEMLTRNGILDEVSSSVDSTLCSHCGRARTQKHLGHEFEPARFVIAHSDIDRSTIDRSIEKFNGENNVEGYKFMILLGSKIIKESYDIKAVRNMMIVSRPDNIPALLQVIGRAVRKNSHIGLPPEKRNVDISIYTSMLPNGHFSYEETKYQEKVADYKIIQQIEKILYEEAIDAPINYDIIKTTFPETEKGKNKTLGILPYTPKISMRAQSLHETTFNGYYAQDEIALVIYIIKRLFIERSYVYTLDKLWEDVRNPPFTVEYNTKLISEDSFSIAVSRLIYYNFTSQSKYADINTSHVEKHIIDKLFDPQEKVIGTSNGDKIITTVDKYLIMIPFNNGNFQVDLDSWNMDNTPSRDQRISVLGFLQNRRSLQSYEEKLAYLMKKYKNASKIDSMLDLICEYGRDFQHELLEKSIVHVQKLMLGTYKLSELDHFMIKLVAYYNSLQRIMTLSTTKDAIKEVYDDIIRQSGASANILKNTVKDTNDVFINGIKSITQQAQAKKLSTEIITNHMPIGHMIDQYPKFYHPERNWFEVPEYGRTQDHYVENDVVIGYFTKSSTGIQTRFKLRKPMDASSQNTADARRVKKGAMCHTKNKVELIDIAKKLKIRNCESMGIAALCEKIKVVLVLREIEERNKKSNIKWFYDHYEPQPFE